MRKLKLQKMLIGFCEDVYPKILNKGRVIGHLVKMASIGANLTQSIIKN